MKFFSIKELSFNRLSKAVKRRISNIPFILTWNYSKKSQKNRMKLSEFKDIHKGKRCFIVANGPSLKKMDLSLLKDEIVIGMNRIYLLEAINGFRPNYIVVTDLNSQLKQFTEEYNELKTQKFFNWNVNSLFNQSENLIFFKESFKVEFQPDFMNPIGTGKSVTFTCLQLAYFMGFREVILIGKDHSYNINGTPHQAVKSNGQEENHFIKGYYEPGMRWDIPDYQGEEYAYRLAQKAFELDGRIIKDATINGKLNVFEKVNFYDLF